MSPLVTASVAVLVVAFRYTAGFAVVVTIYDLLGVSAVRAFMLAKSFCEAFYSTGKQKPLMLRVAVAVVCCCELLA